jgi:oligopeptidase B
MLPACRDSKSVVISTQDDYPAPPTAVAKADTFKEFNNIRVDNYFWIRDRENPDVMKYLEAENAYSDTVMAHTKSLQDKLYKEMRGRIKEDDETVPRLDNGYYYYSRTEKDKQYRIFCRKNGDTTANEEVIFDVNKMAEGIEAYLFVDYEVSQDNKVAAYMFNTTGSYAEFNLKFRDLTTGLDLPYEIQNIQGFTWANDNKNLFYTKANESLRPYRVYRHEFNSGNDDKLIYEEKDELFNTGLYKSKTKNHIYIYSGSFSSTELRFISSDKPLSEFRLFRPRAKDVEYYIEHHPDGIFVKYKDKQNINSKIYKTGNDNFDDIGTWTEIVPHDPSVKIQDVELFEKYALLYIRKDGLDGLTILDLNTNQLRPVEFPEPVFVVSPVYTPEFNSTKCRYSYSSMNRPVTIYDYDMAGQVGEKLKEQEIPGGFNPDDYIVERLWAVSVDSVKVPMAIVYKKGLKKNGQNPVLLYGYGSYGYNTDAAFRSNIFSLVDRGFVFGIAQVRGGSEMGEQWYEDGKLMKKMNSFSDFIACTDYLINEKYTSPERIGINGGSAGGLLVGAVAMMRPELFHVVIADVPFVDIVNTMLDESLPLTTQEYEQWGNPNIEADYKYILSYSPYDNVKAQDYPSILATTGWNDSQVMYHEPAKWVAKLRAMKTDNNIILLKTNLESGHGGATGRFDYLKEVAFRYAFLLDRMGIQE